MRAFYGHARGPLLVLQGDADCLAFDRQHELTQAVAAASFDASLGGDRSARCWLARGLARENPDVEVETRQH
jgi:hypothetical protein